MMWTCGERLIHVNGETPCEYSVRRASRTSQLPGAAPNKQPSLCTVFGWFAELQNVQCGLSDDLYE